MRKLAFVVALASLGVIGCKNVDKSEMVDENLIPVENPTTDSHTAQISLDWSGVYKGTMPCADCEGIETIVELKEDETFLATYIYLGKPESDNEIRETGSFSWDEDGSITLTPVKGEVSRYKVSENRIILLNANNEVNTGELEQMYVLQKKMD